MRSAQVLPEEEEQESVAGPNMAEGLMCSIWKYQEIHNGFIHIKIAKSMEKGMETWWNMMKNALKPKHICAHQLSFIFQRPLRATD